MYVFVRLNAILAMTFGILLIALGLGAIASGLIYQSMILNMANTTIMPGTGYVLYDTRLYTTAVGLMIFLMGLSFTAQGQIAMAYADTARNTGNMVKLLTKMVHEGRPTLINHVNVNTESTRSQTEPVVIKAEVEEK